jgi:hypothetical protein
VDDQRLAGSPRELDLRLERSSLLLRRRPVAEEVQARFADGHAARVAGEGREVVEVVVGEAGRQVRVAADPGVHLRERLGCRERAAAGGAGPSRR